MCNCISKIKCPFGMHCPSAGFDARTAREYRRRQCALATRGLARAVVDWVRAVVSLFANK